LTSRFPAGVCFLDKLKAFHAGNSGIKFENGVLTFPAEKDDIVDKQEEHAVLAELAWKCVVHVAVPNCAA
jgi:hypothetical protein